MRTSTELMLRSGQGISECVFFPIQVSELPSSVIHRDDLQVKEKDQRRPPAVPREVQRTRRMFPSASTPSKYHGYEELLTAKPDPAFTEPKGM
jgi:hypothetical protein